MTVHHLTKRDARRLAVRAQLLTSERPADLFEVVRGLTVLQHDQTAYVAPNADLVAWSRLGSSYDSSELADALASQQLFDLRGFVRPPESIALFRAEMAAWPGDGELLDWQEYRRDWVLANEGCRLDILERLRQDGPLVMRELPDSCVRPWQSSGWTNNRNVSQLLEFMVQRGEVAIAGRDGRDRLFDLASRVYPDDPVVPLADALRIRDEQRLRSMGILRAKGPACPGEPLDAGAAGERAVVEGVRGEWRVDPELLGQPFSGRTAIISPLDRLVYDRKRLTEIFEFDYQLEMYKPAAKRRWGYFALPILHNDRLVGKLDAMADRKAGVLRVDALHEDEPFSKTLAAAVRREIRDLARWLRLEIVTSS
ncbi:crosslink repair DNA glycosylase YcaQ family protein [Kribbella sp. HUAS MG21]|uniref:Crosslink repair DNA glycosylase YcaQ family protein n=1 Tax=Kribbella sp. HUAS MG21 TaxID=3160966 RepID=A0AAU7T6N1_9ACTN